MMGCSSCRTKRRALVWRLSAGLLAMSATILIAIPGANAATADRPPVTTAHSAAPPVQSCNDAYDQTGVGGAGIGQIRVVEKGFYSFSVAFNDDFIAAHPPTTDFSLGRGTDLRGWQLRFQHLSGASTSPQRVVPFAHQAAGIQIRPP